MALSHLCPTCAALTPKPGRCGNCTSTTARGYGHTHQQRRAQLLPHAIGQPCPYCKTTMLDTDELALDHSTPLAIDRTSIGDRIVHATCNSRAGARFFEGRAMMTPPRFRETQNREPSVG